MKRQHAGYEKTMRQAKTRKQKLRIVARILKRDRRITQVDRLNARSIRQANRDREIEKEVSVDIACLLNPRQLNHAVSCCVLVSCSCIFVLCLCICPVFVVRACPVFFPSFCRVSVVYSSRCVFVLFLSPVCRAFVPSFPHVFVLCSCRVLPFTRPVFAVCSSRVRPMVVLRLSRVSTLFVPCSYRGCPVFATHFFRISTGVPPCLSRVSIWFLLPSVSPTWCDFSMPGVGAGLLFDNSRRLSLIHI